MRAKPLDRIEAVKVLASVGVRSCSSDDDDQDREARHPSQQLEQSTAGTRGPVVRHRDDQGIREERESVVVASLDYEFVHLARV